MSVKEKPATKILGLIVGAALLVAGIYSVFFIDWTTEPEISPVPIRPLKTLVVTPSSVLPGRKYPGKVRANREVDLAFQVSGPLIELPVLKSQRVEEGELLARIDPRDFEHTLAAKQAVLDKNKSDVEKITKLLAQNASTEKELTDARSALGVADAEVKIAAKALDDTNLRAPFAGVIADTFVENFQNVQAKERVLSLQEISSVDIEVNVPESRVSQMKQRKGTFKLTAVFDFLPDREYSVQVKEFSTEADPSTQTYAATVTMPAPEDVNILPGMTATVIEQTLLTSTDKPTYLIPVEASLIDEQGDYHVWVVKGLSDAGVGHVQKVKIAVGEMIQDRISVLEGLAEGDRIATAGIHVLQDQQQVRLLRTGSEDEH